MSENTAGSRYEVSVAPRDVATAPSEDFAAVDAVGVARESLLDAASHFAAWRTDENRDMVADCADALIRAVRAECAAKVRIDDAFILAVEEEVGMGNGAWDMVKASDLCRAVLKVAAYVQARAAQGGTDG